MTGDRPDTSPDVRSLAVEIVDSVHRYTDEFAPTASAHRYYYDWVEECIADTIEALTAERDRLVVALRTVGVTAGPGQFLNLPREPGVTVPYTFFFEDALALARLLTEAAHGADE